MNKKAVLIILNLLSLVDSQEYDSGLQDLVLEGAGSLLETDLNADRYQDFQIKFQKKFVIPPQIVVGYTKFKTINDFTKEIGMKIEVKDQTLFGFNVRVTCFSSLPIHKLSISWLATNDPSVIIEYEEISDSTSTATGIGYRDDLRPYFPTSIPQTPTSNIVSINSGFRVSTAGQPWDFGVYYARLSGVPTKILFVRETTCIKWVSAYFIITNNQFVYTGDIRTTAFDANGNTYKEINYGTDIGPYQQAVFGPIEFWAGANGDLDIYIKDINLQTTKCTANIGQATPTNALYFLGYQYFITKQCIKFYTLCSFKGTETVVCSQDPQTQSVNGQVRSLALIKGKKIIFSSNNGNQFQIFHFQQDKKCIFQIDYKKYEII